MRRSCLRLGAVYSVAFRDPISRRVLTLHTDSVLSGPLGPSWTCWSPAHTPALWLCLTRSFTHSPPTSTSNTGGAQPDRDATKTGQLASTRHNTPQIYPHDWTLARASPKYQKMATLETLNFDNLAQRVLPIEPEEDNFVRQVSGACFSKVKPTPVAKPQTVAYSVPALGLIDLPETEAERSDFAEYFSGNSLLPGSQPAAHCYCGHQFGNFAGQLGDGATM